MYRGGGRAEHQDLEIAGGPIVQLLHGPTRTTRLQFKVKF
jgi:hypothetical protein